MATHRPRQLISMLPPTPCTPELREKMVNVAKDGKRSLADVQREAFEFFLDRNSSNARVEYRKARKS
jgi:hypothetical protein